MHGGEGDTRHAAEAYRPFPRDRVRDVFERGVFAQVVPRLIRQAGGGRLLDLGSADGLVADLAGPELEHYLGVDLYPPEIKTAMGDFVAHDLREGLGPVGDEPFDVYLASFGVASHLTPAELAYLLEMIAAHGRPGSIVAIEALGLFSLEWPKLWDTPIGTERSLPYRLGGEVQVHPWAAGELFGAFEAAGISPQRALDRTVQAGPKLGEDRYWPGLPPVRDGLNRLLDGYSDGAEVLSASLPPLPAHPASAVHHKLAARRRAVVRRLRGRAPRAVAQEVWGLEPASGGGFGHGLLVIGRL